jgi:hypothetical protein
MQQDRINLPRKRYAKIDLLQLTLLKNPKHATGQNQLA